MVAELVINRPDKRNAMTDEMWERLPVLIAEVDADPSISVLVVRGSTPEAFCAGADIAEYRARVGDREWADRSRITVGAALDAVRSMAKPSVAAIGGICVGGGVGIALACDLRIADHTATFAIPPARLGLVYPFPDTRDLVLLIGPSRAKRLLYTGCRFDATEALRIGFVDELAETVVDQAHRLADEIASSSQYSVRAMKRTIGLVVGGQFQESEETWRLAGDAMAGEDHAEGIQAFLERRSPRFTYH